MTGCFASRVFPAAISAALLLPTGASAKAVHDPTRFSDATIGTTAVTSAQLREELKRVQFERFTLTVSADTLKVGDTATVELVVRPGGRYLDKLPTVQPRDGATSQPQVTKKLKADLDGGFLVETDLIGEAQKGVRANGDTRWEWNIRAAREGNQKLVATITTPVMFDGTETVVDVRNLEDVVVVIPIPLAPPPDVPFTAQVLKFIGGNWQWLWAAILIPCASWLWKRRQSKTRQRDAG